MGWMAGVRLPTGARDFSFFCSVQASFGDQSASYPMDTGAVYPMVKRKEVEADHSPTSCAEVKKDGAIPLLPPYTGCPRRNVPYFGRVFLMLKYTDITQNTYTTSKVVLKRREFILVFLWLLNVDSYFEGRK
jgi:hypothetical protein